MYMYLATIFVPLFEAGFVKQVLPTSNREECDVTKARICKPHFECKTNDVWCPTSNDVPREQLEIFLNYETDIYMLELQGRVTTNETVVHFLFQYRDERNRQSKALATQLLRTLTDDSSIVNKFIFDPPLRTNYMRITPIEFIHSIALRFEIYSKGVLYSPRQNEDK